MCDAARLDLSDEDTLTAASCWIQTNHTEAQTTRGRPSQSDHFCVMALYAHTRRDTHTVTDCTVRGYAVLVFMCFIALPTLAAERIHFCRRSDGGGVWCIDVDEPLVRMEEEADWADGAVALDGLMALMISWPFLEKLNSLQESGGIWLNCW